MRAPLLLVLLLLALSVPAALAQDEGPMIHAIDEEGQYVFGPARVEVPAGGTVLVMAFGREPHTVQADSGERWVDQIAPGETKTFVAPTTVGEHRYHCTFHPEMVGTLVVTAASVPTPTPKQESPAGGLALVALGIAVALLVRRH